MLFIFNLQREQKIMLIFSVLFIHTLIDVSVHFLVNAKHNIVTYMSQRVFGRCRYCLTICLSYPFLIIYLGCPRNKQFFFQFKPKQTETQSVSVVFRFVSRNQKNIFFGLFQCFGPVSKQPKQTEFSRNKLKKSPKKRSLLGGPQNH
jgi:hypothetical protein